MSPAASTARPEVASTFRWSSRSMPAMPMALSSPPMVVGMRQTSSAMRVVNEKATFAYRPNGFRVMMTNRKITVSAESRRVSAISFGVFCREAPSTIAIMRSMNVLPGSEVTRTTIRSLRTRVPPVTAQRSPPLSRTTGADSPVIADSSTEAMPSITSPSAGMRSPVSQTTVSPRRRSAAETRSSRPSHSRRPNVCVRARFRVSAWALPRPSATASAKLAKSTVKSSQSAIWSPKRNGSGEVKSC